MGDEQKTVEVFPFYCLVVCLINIVPSPAFYPLFVNMYFFVAIFLFFNVYSWTSFYVTTLFSYFLLVIPFLLVFFLFSWCYERSGERPISIRGCNALGWVHCMHDVCPHLMYSPYLSVLTSYIMWYFAPILFCPYYPFLSYFSLLSDEGVYKRMRCMEAMRFLIGRNTIKRNAISANTSSIRNRHNCLYDKQFWSLSQSV